MADDREKLLRIMDSLEKDYRKVVKDGKNYFTYKL